MCLYFWRLDANETRRTVYARQVASGKLRVA